ncbi:MAG: NUDIX domain-containing protein, partial [Limisphaerales bacterium]
KQNRTMRLPNLGERPVATSRRFVAVVVECQERFLVRQRPARVVNAHLWEFPNIEVAPGRDQLGAVQLQSAARQALGFAPARLEPLCSFKHTITRYRITLDVFRAKLAHARKPGHLSGQWLGFIELDKLAFASAHKKVLELFRDARDAAQP